MFWELAKHPEYQARMRKEIRATRAAVLARGDTRFTIDDLDSMTSVMNAIKVRLNAGGVPLPAALTLLAGNAQVPSNRFWPLEGGCPRRRHTFV